MFREENPHGVPAPTPFGRSRKRASQAFDAALDDAELIDARAALAQGRWQAARALLTRTGDEWDLRGHRATVLAAEPYSDAWARDWLVAEPDSADAAVLLALALVQRVRRGKGKPAAAREACRTAARLAPADPTPGWACSCWSATSGRPTRWPTSSGRSARGTPTTTTPTT